ncbi:MAG: iron-containing redox enzyme family protein [Thermoproteota archaeon]|nr:iron-containing redox enzyme family protein [Thermoproteota archaeon]
MDDVVQRIHSEIEKHSLLKHSFYKMWSEGKLTIEHLQGYSKEYFQLVKIVPKFVESIAEARGNSGTLTNNAHEEAEHIELWVKFATALGVSRSDLISYGGSEKTNEAVAKLMGLADLEFEEAVAAMYAYEMELPKISRSKIDGLKKLYGMDSEDATKYFEIHEEADVRHAQVWREILQRIPLERHEAAINAAIKSLQAQNMLLDSVYEKYVKSKDSGCHIKIAS